MSSTLGSVRRVPLRSAALVAVVFFYFLIFAQFGFLHLLDRLESPGLVKGGMAMMAAGGILGSVMAARGGSLNQLSLRLRVGFLGSAAVAVASAWMEGLALLFLAGALGLCVGTLTVSLVGFLGQTVPRAHVGSVCGWGTGLAYAACNIPPLFLASAEDHAVMAGLAGLIGCGLAWTDGSAQSIPAIGEDAGSAGRRWIGLIVVTFTALVWLDSAAFRVIQSDSLIRDSHWADPAHIWLIGLSHLAGAVFAGWWIDRRGFTLPLLGGFSLLAIGYWVMLGHFGGALGGGLYAVGVSLYSAPLVAVALKQGQAATASGRAAWLFAVAGWLGSGMGIGMADDLGRVPWWIWGTFGAVLLLSLSGLASTYRRTAV
jgi:hypothetical protein